MFAVKCIEMTNFLPNSNIGLKYIELLSCSEVEMLSLISPSIRDLEIGSCLLLHVLKCLNLPQFKP